MVSLVIVESPTKIKTVGDILTRLFGKGRYRVLASYGHIRDLPDDTLGVDVGAGFRPHYVISDAKKNVVKRLKAAVKEADVLYLATDPDREGEAMAWHLVQTLRPACPIKRITFNAVTEAAVQAGFATARSVNMSLVAAQESRRILDRLVGYKISPLLWNTLPQSQGLSAGRVQSVALRLVVERQAQIDSFQPKTYWSITGRFVATYGSFEARLHQWHGQPWDSNLLPTQTSADAVIRALTSQAFSIHKLEQLPIPKSPCAPFITATLQQAASSHLSLSPDQTMNAAQKLYEAGQITYIRTDSVAIDSEALKAVRREIVNRFGQAYLAEPRIFKSTKTAQEAHECIRPTHIAQSQLSAGNGFNDTLMALYALIWQRFTASQMADAVYSRTTVQVAGGESMFQAVHRGLTFDGFLRVYRYGDDVAAASSLSDGDGIEAAQLPVLIEGETVQAVEFASQRNSTRPPLRFSDAGLVRELEARGVGRPSTFASTIALLKSRGTVTSIKNSLAPTEIGVKLLAVLVKHFPTLFDVDFTAQMETALDDIAAGSQTAHTFLESFWRDFKPLLDRIGTPISKPPVAESERVCPRCQALLVLRTAKDGRQFFGCSTFPKCRYSQDIDMSTSAFQKDVCPQCGKPLVTRTGKNGSFIGCSGFPTCHFTRSVETSKTPPSSSLGR